MAPNYILGGSLVALGVGLVALHRLLGLLQVRSQPRWMHPWKNAVAGGRSVILIIGIGVMVAGLLEFLPR